MNYQLPDWDAYLFEIEDSLYTDKEELLNSLFTYKKDLDFIKANKKYYTIKIERYKFIPFNPRIKEIEIMLERDSSVSTQEIATKLAVNHNQILGNETFERTFFGLDLLAQIKRNWQYSQVKVTSYPVINVEDTQTLLTEWAKRNSVIDGGDYIRTGEIFNINLQELGE